jgi:tetratricopeptide (TPR) repeat protein
MTVRAISCTWLGVVAVAIAVASPDVRAQDQLSVAKDLYASAAYDDALSALGQAKNSASADLAQIDQYRAFCLFALGRRPEAESIAETLVRKDPLLKLDSRDASPRIEAMFTDIRKRLLPGLIRDAYRSARTALDQGQKGNATEQLVRVREMLADAQAIGVSDEGLGDMGLLVQGFLDLARVAARQPEAPPPGPAPAVQQVAAAARVEPSAPVTAPHVYSALDEGVKAPVALRQEMPRVPVAVVSIMRNANKTGGILEIVIGEDGAVTDAFMREPANATFDSLMIAAAQSWRYRPATRGGQPVRYTKRIAVSVAPTSLP